MRWVSGLSMSLIMAGLVVGCGTNQVANRVTNLSLVSPGNAHVSPSSAYVTRYISFPHSVPFRLFCSGNGSSGGGGSGNGGGSNVAVAGTFTVAIPLMDSE